MRDQNELMVWLDLETFGLTPDTGPIIELGVVITDLDLNQIDAESWTMWSEVHELAWNHASDLVRDMHTKSGLIQDARNNPDHASIKGVTADFLQMMRVNGVEPKKQPMCGSSLRMDRLFLATQALDIENFFHYRMIDVSAIKELCRRFNPRVFAQLSDDRRKQEADHRTLSDIQASADELRFYLENFMFDAHDIKATATVEELA